MEFTIYLWCNQKTTIVNSLPQTLRPVKRLKISELHVSEVEISLIKKMKPVN